MRLRLLHEDREFVATKDIDYGLILKCPNPHSEGEFVFVVAGIAEFGTHAAGQYLLHKWDSLFERSQGKPFLCVLEVPIRDPERCREIHFANWNLESDQL